MRQSNALCGRARSQRTIRQVSQAPLHTPDLRTHGYGARCRVLENLVQRAIIVIELPCNVPIWVQHYPRIVLAQPYAHRCVEGFPHFVF
jgi:hypothetical protein